MASRLKELPKGGGRRIKAPPEAPALSRNNEPPVFSLHSMAAGFCIDECDRDQKAAFADALWRRSQLTWHQFRNADRAKLGLEQLPQTAINGALPRVVSPDTQLLVFRAGAAGRVVGFRDDGGLVFHILWVDPGLRLYEH